MTKKSDPRWEDKTYSKCSFHLISSPYLAYYTNIAKKEMLAAYREGGIHISEHKWKISFKEIFKAKIMKMNDIASSFHLPMVRVAKHTKKRVGKWGSGYKKDHASAYITNYSAFAPQPSAKAN